LAYAGICEAIRGRQQKVDLLRLDVPLKIELP